MPVIPERNHRLWNQKLHGQNLPKGWFVNAVWRVTSNDTVIVKIGMVLKPKGIRLRLTIKNRWTK